MFFQGDVPQTWKFQIALIMNQTLESLDISMVSSYLGDTNECYMQYDHDTAYGHAYFKACPSVIFVRMWSILIEIFVATYKSMQKNLFRNDV